MTKIKNIRPGIVIITDAGLKLAPGEVVELEKLTPQVSRAIDSGIVATVETQAETKPRAKSSGKTATGKPETKEETPASTGDGDSTEGDDGSR